MAKTQISVPQVVINDEVYRIVPNSFVYDAGEPEINVRAASTGNGATETVHSENTETSISSCKFDIFLDAGVDEKIAGWKKEVGGNTIKINQRNVNGVSFVRTFPGMSLTNKIERNASADGVTSLEWMGDRMILG
jgi:hypothetical protein